jgi:hypothetical protein
MASDKPRFLVSQTYSIVTPRSAEIGDFAEIGCDYHQPMSLEETVKELRRCCQTSCWPVRRNNMTGHEWASTEPTEDYQTGNTREESIHIARPDGSPLDGRNLYRLWKLAGLIAR